MTPGRDKHITSPVHRLGLTHGQGGVPKFIRENSEQFFAAVTREKSTIKSASKPTISTEFSTQYQPKQTYKIHDEKKQENLFSTSTSKPLTPIRVLPPVRTASTVRSKAVASASACIHQPPLSPFIPSPSNSLESSTSIIKSPTLLRSQKRQFRHDGPVDQDLFRKAYERALSVARSRLLFHDPYSLTRASATHGILYSYYDHTPMCVFSRGTACNHRQNKTNKQERKTKSDLSRKKIFNDVIVEHYIQ
jgi:hypothetical protein